MLKIVARKLLFMFITIIIMSMLIFMLVEVMPGDVAQIILGMNATEENLMELRSSMGLDRPAYVRYLNWVGNALQGDLGDSYFIKGVSVASLIARKGLHSLVLAITAFLIFVPLSIFFGVLSGANEGKWYDKLISNMGLILMSLPEFVVGIMLIIVFPLGLGLFPISSTIPMGQDLWSNLDILILPALSVTIMMLGYLSRMQRASMISTMKSEYIRAARLKGLKKNYVVMRHVLRNALLPTITIIGMNMGWLFGGLVVVEALFGFPGIGSLLVVAIKSRDLPVIEASMILITIIYIASSTITDLLYVFFNPRIRYK